MVLNNFRSILPSINISEFFFVTLTFGHHFFFSFQNKENQDYFLSKYQVERVLGNSLREGADLRNLFVQPTFGLCKGAAVPQLCHMVATVASHLKVGVKRN